MSKLIKSRQSTATDQEVKTITIRNLFEENAFQLLIDSSEEDGDVQSGGHLEFERAKTRQLKEVKQEAEEMIEQAKKDIEKMYEQLERDQQQATEQQEVAFEHMKEQGYKEGLQQGREDGFSEYSAVIEEANTVIMSAKDEYNKVLADAEPVIVELAVELTKRMINEHLEPDSPLWGQLVKQVIKEVQEHEEVKIYVHPTWFERTRQQKEELQHLLSHTEVLYIYADAQLSENGCIIESKFGRIDATVDHQLEELKKQLLVQLEEVDHESEVFN
ncbi:flagellar assembly protein FliH [Bacillus sp. FJAT-45037]|uniref:flagellar assembly protein FliH n=1 Tax=Bacillus sp. FJAT-45037 TaxID=2011007 RepID=UPI000C244FA7|nr:flagellar assembly protein FliH [Bacillus sp. FJAT-45037]